MEVIDKMVTQQVDTLGLWVANKAWYWIPVVLGFLIRVGLEKYKTFDAEKRAKAIIGNILILVMFTLMWNNLRENSLDENSAKVLIGGIIIYIFYGIAKKCERTGGYTESLLLIINSVMLTTLSFQSFCGTIFGAIVTIAISYAAYRFWVEKMCDLVEIIVICIEAIIISGIMKVKQANGFFDIFFYVLYVETVIFTVNWCIKIGVAYLMGEEVDD